MLSDTQVIQVFKIRDMTCCSLLCADVSSTTKIRQKISPSSLFIYRTPCTLTPLVPQGFVAWCSADSFPPKRLQPLWCMRMTKALSISQSMKVRSAWGKNRAHIRRVKCICVIMHASMWDGRPHCCCIFIQKAVCASVWVCVCVCQSVLSAWFGAAVNMI